jgi:hypothetical protein
MRKNTPLGPILSHTNPVHLLPELSCDAFGTKYDGYTAAARCVEPRRIRAELLQVNFSIKVEVTLYCESYSLYLTTGTLQEIL